MPPTEEVLEAIVNARADGANLRQAAAAGGVHVATLCRWQSKDPDLRDDLQAAHLDHRRQVLSARRPRRHVPWRRDCPRCNAAIVVRTAPGKLVFWRCERWPDCTWASWRPAALRKCSRC